MVSVKTIVNRVGFFYPIPRKKPDPGDKNPESRGLKALDSKNPEYRRSKSRVLKIQKNPIR